MKRKEKEEKKANEQNNGREETKDIRMKIQDKEIKHI